MQKTKIAVASIALAVVFLSATLFGGDNESFQASTLPEFEGSAPSLEYCEKIKEMWDLGGWSRRFEEKSILSQCLTLYFKGNWIKDPGNGPTEFECVDIRAEWEAGNYTARFGTDIDAVFCADVYPAVWRNVHVLEDPKTFEENLDEAFEEEPFADISVAETAAGHEAAGAGAGAGELDIEELRNLAALYLASNGVIGGYKEEDGSSTFRGEGQVNRAEAAVFLLRARYGAAVADADAEYDGSFVDVENDVWYTKFIVKAVDLGIMRGYEPDLDDENEECRENRCFKPGNPVNTVEFLAMLARAYGEEENLYAEGFEDVDDGIWYQNYAGLAWEYALFPERGSQAHPEPMTLRPTEPLTRFDTAVGIYQYLKNS